MTPADPRMGGAALGKPKPKGLLLDEGALDGVVGRVTNARGLFKAHAVTYRTNR